MEKVILCMEALLLLLVYEMPHDTRFWKPPLLEKPETFLVSLLFILWDLWAPFSHLDILVVTCDEKFYLKSFF